jgi:uncharacterized membrane protein affecting hemolysin expression
MRMWQCSSSVRLALVVALAALISQFSPYHLLHQAMQAQALALWLHPH